MKFKVKKRTANILSEGTYVGKINEAKIVNSFEKNLRGELKDVVPNYANPTRQIALVLVADNGVITTRIQADAFKKYDELSQKQIDSGKYQEENGYAVAKLSDLPKGTIPQEIIDEFDIQPDDLVRIPDAEKQESCINIMGDVCTALGADEDDDVLETIENAVINETEVQFTVYSEVYNGKDVKKVKGWKKATEPAEAAKEEVSKEDF